MIRAVRSSPCAIFCIFSAVGCLTMGHVESRMQSCASIMMHALGTGAGCSCVSVAPSPTSAFSGREPPTVSLYPASTCQQMVWSDQVSPPPLDNGVTFLTLLTPTLPVRHPHSAACPTKRPRARILIRSVLPCPAAMPPDLNSLPPSSPSPTNVPLQPRVSPAEQLSRTMSQSPLHSQPHSLAAAATMNAGMQNDHLRRPSSGSMVRDVERARRRSSIRMNLNLNDPALPAPGEMQTSPSSRNRGAPWPPSPHHERAPSLGELHQELEYEQEGQVVGHPISCVRASRTSIDTLGKSTLYAS